MSAADWMASTSRQIGGKRAQAQGAMFEDAFFRHCRGAGMAITRMPDGCKQLSQHKIIRVKSPFDWIITFGGKTALIDTKSTKDASFHHSMIDQNQVRELRQHAEAGAISGYVIYLRKIEKIIFVSSRNLWIRLERRGSIGEDNGIDLGTIGEMKFIRAFGVDSSSW